MLHTGMRRINLGSSATASATCARLPRLQFRRAPPPLCWRSVAAAGGPTAATANRASTHIRSEQRLALPAPVTAPRVVMVEAGPVVISAVGIAAGVIGIVDAARTRLVV